MPVCVLSNYFTISDCGTLRGKVDESGAGAAAPLPGASGLGDRTAWFFYLFIYFVGTLKLSDHLFRTGADTVEQLGTIDEGYFYCAVWLKGKR